MRSLPEWIGATDDAVPPPRVRLRVFEHHHGVCQGNCGHRKITAGESWECDHIIAIANGGENRETNLHPLCGWCHKKKTRADVALKSKNYERRLSHVGIRKPRSITRWRRFNGEVVVAGRER